MKTLTKQLLETEGSQSAEYVELDHLPEKVLQFGKGNFLRAFVDWQIHQLNKQHLFNGKVVIYQPSPHGQSKVFLEDQDFLYTVVLRGIENGKKVDTSEVISSVSRSLSYDQWSHALKLASSEELELIISNTTEAGITYVAETPPNQEDIPKSFPAKLTMFLFERYQRLGERKAPGLTILPCELIEQNGTKLKEYTMKYARDWQLPVSFIEWIEKKNTFCNTLVDRIVTGYPHDSIEEYHERLGYEDKGLTVGEPYHLFVIDGGEDVQRTLPLSAAQLNVKWGDITPYREIKVRLLNGPHTMMFSVGHLFGLRTVQEVMETESTRQFVEAAFHEIKQVVSGDEQEKEAFIASVKERFLNPYNHHHLLDIGLNAINKFKARLLPTLKRFVEEKGELPQSIVFSMASLFLYYKPIRREDDGLVGLRDGVEYKMKENEDVLSLVTQAWEFYDKGGELATVVSSLLQAEHVWGEDVSRLPGLHEAVTNYLQLMLEEGMSSGLERLLNDCEITG
ncbi:tagaturonate reductase [Halalkalibacter sp. APA_J-10(15)]|uniref:tagaturonate reductase n=1 Tax=Halalkalibacter sp. APA_J-10(15) TaxID=2933805 RepID=UPI001FF6CF66|nr:tagaturonate reductase [Halalkalibacter sp. APA_J-10(15)]MCK0473477.1 tagaturonate reductase [Halalkalibacter sp. APA_J-10(15)]